MSEPLTVRRFQLGEAMLLRTVRREALSDSPNAFGSSLVEEWDMPDERLEAWIGDDLMVGAFEGRVPVAMAGLVRLKRHKVSHRAELFGFYVRPAWRGTGTADRVMQTVFEQCDRGIRQIELNVVAGNPAALAFYRRHGFREIGRIPSAIRTDGGYLDEIMMVRARDT